MSTTAAPSTAGLAGSAPEPRRKRSRARRWLLRLLVALLALMAVAVVVTQIVLSFTNIPQRIIVAQLQRTLGLRVAVGGVTTGWIGHTTLRDVTFALPLAEQPLAVAPVVRVRHSWLPSILATQSLSIEAIDIDRATLEVVQQDSGEWNVQRAIAQIRLSAPPPRSDESRLRVRPTIPAIKISRATLAIRDDAGRQVQLAPVEFSGNQQGALVWRFSATVQPGVSISGELIPGASWQHQLDFTLRDVSPLLQPWLARWPSPTNVTAHWDGRATSDGGIMGRIVLANTQVGAAHPHGVAVVSLQDGTLKVQPDRLLIDTGRDVARQIKLVSGALLISGHGVEAQSMEMELASGAARLNGKWHPRDEAATLDASWRDLRIPATTAHNGQLHAEVASPLPGQPQVRITVQSAGTVAGAGSWESQASLIGEGTSWDQLQFQLRGDHLAWHGVRQFALDNLRATIATHGRRATLQSVQLEGSEQLSGRGAYNFDHRSFWLWLRGDELTIASEQKLPLSFMINAWGDSEQVRLQQIFAQAPDLELSGDGYYVYRRPKPLELELWLRLVPGALQHDRASPLLTGSLHSAAHVIGTASPLALELDGHFFADDLVVAERNVGDVKMRMTGQVDGRDAHVNFSQFKLFDADCQLSAVYPTDGRRAAMQVDAAITGLSLAKLGEFLGTPDLSGELEGTWKLEIPPDDFRQTTGTGTFSMTGVSADRFSAESIRGTTRLADQQIALEPVYLSQRHGSAEARAQLSLAQPTRVELKLKTQEWPLDLPRAGAKAKLSGTADLRVDLLQRSATGALNGATSLTVNDRSLGRAQLRADLRGRAAQVEQFTGELLDGTIEGNGTVDLDNVEANTFDLSWKWIDGAQIALFLPQAQGLDGTYTGELHLKSTRGEKRPLEPLRLDVNSYVKDGHWRGVQIGDGYWSAYLSRRRAVLDKSQFDVAGGRVNLWARTSAHGSSSIERRIGMNVIADYDSLDLDQIVHALAPKTRKIPGRISGSMQLVGEPAHPGHAVGSGRLVIRDSDLANLGPVSFLYNAMHLDIGDVVPTGRGSAEFRVEGDDLILSQLRYFNRGTEIRASGAVQNIRGGAGAKLDIGAVGSARPLSQIKIPGFASVDKIFALLQSNLTTVHVGGTLGEPKTRIVSFQEISQTLRAIVFGDYQEEKAAQEQNR